MRLLGTIGLWILAFLFGFLVLGPVFEALVRHG